MRKIVLLGMVLLMLAVIPAGCPAPVSPPEPPEVTEPQIGLSKGKIAPNFQLEDLDGNLVSLWDLRGKVVFLYFWASWCGNCKGEMPDMETIYQDYKDRGFEILTVNIKGDREKIKSFMEQKGFSFPVLLDSDGIVAWIYQVNGVPATYIIDPQGIIQEVLLGSRNWTDSLYRQMIEELLPAEEENGSKP